ncbi:hypothetical protein, partial [Novosphingobium sp. 11B]
MFGQAGFLRARRALDRPLWSAALTARNGEKGEGGRYLIANSTRTTIAAIIQPQSLMRCQVMNSGLICTLTSKWRDQNNRGRLCPQRGVGSTGGGNTSLETLGGCLVFERFPWSFVELPGDSAQFGLA